MKVTTIRIMRQKTQHNRGTVELRFEEEKLGLYLVSPTTRLVGHSFTGIFSLFFRSLDWFYEVV